MKALAERVDDTGECDFADLPPGSQHRLTGLKDAGNDEMRDLSEFLWIKQLTMGAPSKDCLPAQLAPRGWMFGNRKRDPTSFGNSAAQSATVQGPKTESYWRCEENHRNKQLPCGMREMTREDPSKNLCQV